MSILRSWCLRDIIPLLFMKRMLFTKLKKLPFHYLGSVGISFVFIFLSTIVIWRNSAEFPLAVPLWFSREWGEQRLAEPVFLWIIPLISLIVVITNLFLSRFFDQKEPILSSILIWSTPIVSGLFFYTVLEIVSVVT